jgi:ligand-binding sensor domain-containing protein
LKKLDASGNWKGFDSSLLITDPIALGLLNWQLINQEVFGYKKKRSSLSINESEIEKSPDYRKYDFTLDLKCGTLAVDRNNRIWIGTQKGLVSSFGC